MATLLENLAILNDNDRVGVTDGRQSMPTLVNLVMRG